MSPTNVERRTVDLSAYPNLVVIYLGMRLKGWRGLKTAMRFGSQIDESVKARPDGLLLHEQVFFSFMPLHAGMRQYWRDFESLERWVRLAPHRDWWQSFLKDSGGTGFWHETYFMRGGMEAIYDDLPSPIGMMKFATVVPARGPMFGARARAGKGTTPEAPASVDEAELYRES